jgi:hypothetical protein
VEQLLQNPAVRRLRFLKLARFSGDCLPALLEWPGFASLFGFAWGDRGDWSMEVARLAASPAVRELRELSIHQVMSPEQILAVLSSPHLARLAALELTGEFRGQGGLDLVRSCALPALEHLRLGGVDQMDDAVVEALLASDWFPRIRSLSLRFCELGDAAAVAIAQHPASAGLEFLDLAFNHIGLRGAKALVQSPFLAGLRKLVLAGNRNMPNNAHKPLVAAFGKRLVF